MTVPADRIQVGLLAYRRVAGLDRTLANLAAQEGMTSTVFLWDNTDHQRSTLESIARDSDVEVAIEGIGRNVGGLGMFAFLHEAAALDQPIVMVDDDVVLAPDALVTWRREWAPLTMSSFWAFRLNSCTNYFDRIRSPPGEFAHYCGTGGTVLDGGVLGDEALFRCPARYRMVWDLWLSYYASQCGYGLFRSHAEVGFVQDGNDSYRGLKGLKSEFLRYLVANGWDLPVAGRDGAARVA